MIPISQSELRCPNCGAELGGFGPDDTCAGLRCLSCEYVGAVTTNPNHPALDQTSYTVWVDWAGHDRLRAIAQVANTLCIDVKVARDLIDTQSPVRVGIRAMQVKKLSRMFKEQGLSIRVEPKPLWTIDAV